MIFAAPKWLYALAMIPVFAVLAYWSIARLRKGFEGFARPGIWSRIMPEFSSGRRRVKVGLWLACYALVVLALARPQWGEKEESVQSNGLDVMVLLDVSNSMNVEDIVPSRLQRAKRFIRNLADRIRGDRMGLAVFAGSTYLVTPLTTDIAYILESLETVGPHSVAKQGTDIGIALAEAANAMERGAEQSDAQRIIVLVSDGEDLEERAVAGAQELARQNVLLYAFGVGTAKGGPVPVRDPQGTLQGFKRDRGGQPVISTFRPHALKQLAAVGNGQYWDLTNDESEVDQFAEEIGVKNRKMRGERVIRVKQEQYQVPLALAILILFFELSIPLHRLAAFAGLVLALGSVMSPASALAVETTGLRAYLENRKGVRALEAQKGAEAEQAFRSAQGHDPGHPSIQFNLGTALATQKGETSLPQAAEELRQAAERAEKIGDHETAAKAQYNGAEIQKQVGNTDGATRGLLSALDHAMAMKDQALETDIRKKLEEIADKQEQQRQQKNQKQDQQQSQQQQQGQDQSQAKQDPQKGSQQDQKQQTPDPKKGDQEQKSQQVGLQRFQSRTLTKDDAERVMNELSEREKDLQARKRRERGGQGGGNEKDW